MIEKRPFGRTGHMSTATLFGAAALGRATQAEVDRTLEILFRCGVNHIDDAASCFQKRPIDAEMEAMLADRRISSLFGLGA